MKKIISIVVSLAIVFSLAAACHRQAENSCPYAVMVNDEIYYYTDFTVAGDVDESAIDGYITKAVSVMEMPDENGEANMDILDAPYAFTDMGLVILINNEWTKFELRE